MIPYEDIDVEVRHLVRLMNQFPGIVTVGSCAGHAEGEETSITFIADSQMLLREMLEALPFWGFRGGFVNNQPQSRVIWITAYPEGGRIVYDLRIGGTPRHVQRGVLAEVEAALQEREVSRVRDARITGGDSSSQSADTRD